MKEREDFKKEKEACKEEEKEHLADVWKAKQKEIKNYVLHTAIKAVFASEGAWNVCTGVWIVTWKWKDAAWCIKARLCIRGFMDRQKQETHKYSPTATRVGPRLLLSMCAIHSWVA